MPAVFVTSKIPEEGLTLLRQKGYSVEVNDKVDLPGEKLKEAFSKYDAVITLITDKVDTNLISSSGASLKIISNYAVGFDNIDVAAAKQKGIAVTNTPGVASESVAEHTFALILACVKQIVEADKFVRLGKYKKWDPYSFVSPQVWGKTIGIIGLGKIGTFVGQIAKNGFRMNILYFDISRSEDFELLSEAKFADVATIVKEADIVTLHVPLNEHTKHLIGERELSSMKKTAILINTSRGPVIDETALINALSEKRIAAAGLDVFEHEPDIPESLTALPNVVMTPHSASATMETRVQMSKIAAQNIIDVFEGKEPVGLVKI
ncbi:D-glycerate dehydrogenase [Candidatus Curtissbacteria bacterium]|nr:D-glycerate dehydrogenase [Candidatus Curtissbacteria bacterium]